MLHLPVLWSDLDSILVAERHTVTDFKVKLMYKSGGLRQASECSYRSSQLSKQVKVICGKSLLVQGH